MVTVMKKYLFLILCIIKLSNAAAFDSLTLVFSISERAEGYLIVIDKKSCIVRNFHSQKDCQSAYFNNDIFDWGGDTIIVMDNKKIVAKKFMRTNGGNMLYKKIKLKSKDRRTLENLVNNIQSSAISPEERSCTDLWIYKLYINNLLICSGYETLASQQSKYLGELFSFIKRITGVINLIPLA